MYRLNNMHPSKGVILGVLTFWILIAMLLMAVMSGIYFHWQLGKTVDKYVWEHRCTQIENTDLWFCDNGIIEL